MSGWPKDGEQVAAAGLLEQLVGHREIGVHSGGQDGQLAEAHRLAGLLVGPGVEGEAAHDQDIEVAAGLERGLADEVRPNGPVLRPDRDRDAPSSIALAERAGGLEEAPGERIERLEAQALALDPVVDAGRAEVVEDRLDEAAGVLDRSRRVDEVLGAIGDDAVGRQALDGERPGYPDDLRVDVRAVEQDFRVGVAGDRGVDLGAGHALADLGVLGDRLESHMRDALVHEALADVALGRAERRSSGELGLPALAFERVRHEVVGYFAAIRRVRASASATRLVSIVIQRLPHCSATYAVVPEPQVGSRTRSPGSVVMRRQRATTLGLVWTT